MRALKRFFASNHFQINSSVTKCLAWTMQQVDGNSTTRPEKSKNKTRKKYVCKKAFKAQIGTE
jgi:hypothetical protein